MEYFWLIQMVTPLVDNNCTNNPSCGINLQYSADNNINNNSIMDNGIGINDHAASDRYNN